MATLHRRARARIDHANHVTLTALRIAGNASAEAVLQATTSSLIPCDFQKSRIFDRVAFDCGKRFGAVRHARRVAQVNEMLVRKTFVQRAIDSQSTDAAVKDADGKEFRIADFGLRIADFKFSDLRIPISNPQFEIRNPKFKGWWRRRELNSDPRANAERLYMLSRFSFSVRQAGQKFARCRVSEVTRPRRRASPTLSRPTPTDRRIAPAHLSDISLRAHEQLAARRSVLN